MRRESGMGDYGKARRVGKSGEDEVEESGVGR